MNKLTYIAIASTLVLAACDQMGSNKTTYAIDYSNQNCDQLKSLAVEKAEMAGIAHTNDGRAAAQATIGVVGGVAAAAPIAGTAVTMGAIASDREDRKVDAQLQKQYNDIIAVMDAKNCY